MNCKE